MVNQIVGTFRNERLRGTFLDDHFTALSGDDTLVAGNGTDILDGGLGFDTADYTRLGSVVTLGALGVVDKGAFGQDVLRSIERVNGSALDGDLIDLSGAVSIAFPPISVTGANVNLSTSLGTVVVNGSGGGLPVSVRVSSFENVLGTIYNDTIVGSGDDNVLNGNDGDDVLDGQGGDDVLLGGDGQDVLIGGGGRDTVIGGLGRDTMSGGSGNDRFAWSSTTESPHGAFDSITDFSRGYILDIQLIDANASIPGNQAFTWIGSAAFSGEGQLRFEAASGGVFLQGNTSGASGVELEIFLAGVIGTVRGLSAVGLPANLVL
jgi:serralysin